MVSVKKACGICGGPNSPKVPCSSLAQIKGSTDDAPTMVSWVPRFHGMLPPGLATPVTVTEAQIVEVLGAWSPDGRSPISVTDIQVLAPRRTGMGGPAHTAVRDASGAWTLTLTDDSHMMQDVYGLVLTLDNGKGTTEVTTWWSRG